MHAIPNSMLTPGTQLGSYRILSRLGKEMGDVYKVVHVQSEQLMALKVLPPSACTDEGLKLFKHQAKELGLLSHKNILTIETVGLENNICYVVTTLLEGQTLQSKLTQSPLPWHKALKWTIEIAEGLAAAHASGIVHGDLNPKNLYVTSSGCIKILDFGLARFTRPGLGNVVRSVPYLSPEQVAGDDADFRSDIFSLGCVLYEMISGRCPFARPSVFETVTAILREEPQKLSELKHDIPLELDQVISHCFEKKPGARFPSMRDFIIELRQVLDLSQVNSMLPKTRHWSAAIATVAVVVALMYLKFCSAG
jgi:serine/threonine protein kinase